MCVRPPSAARSARAERAAAKAVAAGGSRASMSMRPRSCSNVSTASSTWSPTGMNVTSRDTVSGRWVEDAAARTCAKCEKAFSLVNRRHHCRVCGEIFCHACSRTRMVLATNPGEIPRRQRVCDPCATHAHSSAVLYEAEETALGPRFCAKTEIGEIPTVTEELLLAKEKQETTVIKTQSKKVDTDSSLSFMVASAVGFAAAFWFLKDEVAMSNPAIWILLAGFVKNVYEIVLRISAARQFTDGVTDLEDAEKIFSGMDLDATDDLSTTTTATSTSAVSEKPKENKYASVKITPALSDELIASSQKSLDKVLELANSDVATDSAWTEEIPTTENVTVHSRDGKPSRIYKCEGEIPLSPDELFDELYTNLETSNSWNVTAAESNVICKLDETTDLVHLISAPALGGVISSRDFVNTRTWRRQDGGGYVIANSYAGKNILKPQKGITRGENGPTGWVILPHPTSPFKSRLIWILNMDIKGYFPSSVIRKGSIGEVSCFVRNLRRYIAENNAGAEYAAEQASTEVQ
ncbi:hypothetical protein JG687_00008683 [Phytophthora cactorum]|uniref:START-like domain n=1 Tax=Phytophthora cactorum TaxID=29920 RepID=A0A329SR38_9STRA|nr:hypothetical protein Pcac1_g12557 [Phytophthora cactorum]KAG2829755.1 hypothetical protein PC112_g7976 [Phytophthora cactorum]KAG2839889.1 hypothetical protein PC111_g3688 [Phytophthora cactorum]KAG2865349.1 hypothetical protein PC113_g3782 [Phytophthora cactorum]KAG2925271.1 hypothetical protein PC114_g4182 [Phytophthora cactorum]